MALSFLKKQIPSLPDARPRSDRFLRSGRESNFLAEQKNGGGTGCRGGGWATSFR